MTDFEIAVFGLGNPGEKYVGTRHNVGFEALDKLAARHGRGAPYMKHRSWLRPAEIGGVPVLLAKPLTYMNDSGSSVRAVGETFGLEPNALWVVVDDFNLPLGALRIRQQGSDGGHNGLNSIIRSLQSQSFPRFRLGIGAPAGKTPTIDFVLGQFRKSEQEDARELMEYATDAVEWAVEHGLEKAMSRFNRPEAPSEASPSQPSTSG